MPEQPLPTGAVFLSYASQDADAAARIGEALRAAGVEVWLDRSELRGGDAWDSQIKRQIRDCALFVPLISAHTNARLEGYFRGEWHLATRRLVNIAHDAAFLVPVVIDETREADARVPEEFFRVQWTWLPGGEAAGPFAAQVKAILERDDSRSKTDGSIHLTARSPESRPGNLPAQATRLIGRDRELAEIVALLRLPDVRCVTLTGAGGIGKTRLALAAAAELVGDYADGVFFIPLAAISDRSLVHAQIARALGLNEKAGQDLQAYVAGKCMLLVLDNVEQVVDSAPDLARLLENARRVRILATGREALHVAAERNYPLPPLGVPDSTAQGNATEVAGSSAVSLFVERARAVDPSFEITDANASVIAAICVGLDGLPLALELAAAHIASLSPNAILARLIKPFKFLKGGYRDAPERHQALERTLAWSFERLGDDERLLFSQLGVFAGGFCLDAVESVCDVDLDALSSLVNKSLVRRDGERYAMLRTIRGYALERLALSGNEAALCDRHAAFFQKLVATAFVECAARSAEWADNLEREHDNLRAALDWLGKTAPDCRLRMAGQLGWFWHAHSHLAEGRSQLSAALAGRSERSEDRALALSVAGALAGYQGQIAAGRPMIDEGIEIWRELGRARELAQALFDLGWGCFFAGDDPTARRCMEESLQICRQLGDPGLVNRSQLGLLQVLVAQGELESVPLLCGETRDLARKLDDPWAEHFADHFLADCALIQGDCATAAAHYSRSLVAAARSGDKIETCYELQGVAMANVGLGRLERALRIAGAADAQLQSLGHKFNITFWSALLDLHLGKARAALGAEAEAAWQAGRRMSLESAVAEASAS